jgi:hypothetical protein
MADRAARSRADDARWLRVWSRAVIEPAWRRALGVWLGAGIVGAIVFGPTAMRPHDLTELALRDPPVGIVLAVTWLLLFVPTARVLVRGDGARYLRSLPGPTLTATLLAAGAVIALQLPWVALWLFGEHARGVIVVGVETVVIAGIAWWRPPASRARIPRWSSSTRALVGVYARAVRRRAGDALVRGVGLAVLAGVAAGMLVRNNELVGQDAATMGGAVIAIILVPAQVGTLITLVETYRATTWLTASLGVTAFARTATLAITLVALYAGLALIAAGATAIVLGSLGVTGGDVGGGDVGLTIAWVALTAIVVAIG